MPDVDFASISDEYDSPQGVVSFQVKIEGMLIEGLKAGDPTKPVIVFIHGQYCDGGSWMAQLTDQKLQAEYFMLAWHAPGYGQSETWPHYNPSALNFAVLLQAFIATEVDTSVTLVGHGLGALIASAFAARFPTLTDGLLLVAPELGYIRAGMFKKRTGVQDNYMLSTFGAEAYAKERLKYLIVPNPDTFDEEAKKELRIMFNLPQSYPIEFKLTGTSWQVCANKIMAWLMKLAPSVYETTSWTLMNEDLESYRRYYHGYAAVFAGEFDALIKKHEAERIAYRYHSVFELFMGQGHLFHLEAPDLFNEKLIAFMQARAQYLMDMKIS